MRAKLQNKKKALEKIDNDTNQDNTSLVFKCKLTTGPDKGKVVEAKQSKNSMYGGTENIKDVEEGDSILVMRSNDTTGGNWVFVDYYRLNKIYVLAVAFALALILIGKFKGVNALISLSYTGLFAFAVFIPWILGGHNIYLGTALTCFFTIIMSLLILEGLTKKSLVTILGCCMGTGIAAIITVLMNKWMMLSGLTDEHSMYITMLSKDKPIDLLGLVFAGIVIGAIGAIMDVAMDISSSMNEIVRHVPDIHFVELLKSGMQIGRDVMGTMANTLVLAYIGSSLTDVMILITYSSSFISLMNKEMVIVEMAQALIASLAVLLTVPFTVIVAGTIYLGSNKSKKSLQ